MRHSVQIYSIRNFGSFDDRLARVARAGFTLIESVATQDLPPAEFAAALRRRGLALSSMHAGLDLVESRRPLLVEACRLTGCPLVVMPFLPWGSRPRSAAGWAAMGERLATIGRAFANDGIRFAYHNHDWEFLDYDGRPGIAWMFEAAPANELGWEVDVGWLVRSGQPARQWLDAQRGRIVAAHVKELAPEGQAADEDGWTTLGEGVVPWEELLPSLRAATDLLVLEHDNPREPDRFLDGSIAFMRRVLR